MGVDFVQIKFVVVKVLVLKILRLGWLSHFVRENDGQCEFT